MFPLKKRKISGYRFKQKTAYSKYHLGTDYACRLDELYAPFDGKIIEQLNGVQGGLTIWFKPDDQDVIIRFLHLNKFLKKTGQKIKEGEKIAITGNTGLGVNFGGKLVNNAIYHLHLDISKRKVILKDINNFLNPEKFNWDNNMLITKQQLEKIYQLVFKRGLDNNAMGYIGKDLDFVMDELLKSKEHQYYSDAFKSIKRIEKEL